MNVYEKLNKARVEFQSANLKKSGKNDYADYTYYELGDILPFIIKIAEEIKFSCLIDFGKEYATLTFIDTEKPEDRVVFSVPMSEANQKGCQPVQNLGSVQTYLKRYLYQNCFEIVESDFLDKITGKDEVETLTIEMANLIAKENLTAEQLECIKKAIADKNVKTMKVILYKHKNSTAEKTA